MHSLVIFVGAKESQKTLLLQSLVERHRQKGHVFLVADTLGHWVRKPGLHVLHGVHDGEKIARYAIALSEHIRAGLTLVLDEGWKFFHRLRPPHPDGALFSLLRTGRQPNAYEPWRRRYPIAIMTASQQPHDFVLDVRNLTSRLYVGHLPGPEDQKWLRDMLQGDKNAAREAGTRPLGKFKAYEL